MWAKIDHLGSRLRESGRRRVSNRKGDEGRRKLRQVGGGIGKGHDGWAKM